MDDKQIQDYFRILFSLLEDKTSKKPIRIFEGIIFRHFVLENLWNRKQELDFYGTIYAFTHPKQEKFYKDLNKKYNTKIFSKRLNELTYQDFKEILLKINKGQPIYPPHNSVYEDIIKLDEDDYTIAFFTHLLKISPN